MNRSRVEQLREWMPPDIDAAIVETEVNRFYFSDFSSSAGTLIVTREKGILVVERPVCRGSDKIGAWL